MKPPTRSLRRGSPDERPEYRRLLPPRKPNNTPLIIGLGVGGFFVLIVIIAVAASGGKTPPPPPPPKVRVAAPAPVDDIGAQNTGRIMWICSGTERHEDKEVIFPGCPGCGSRSKFYPDREIQAYRCHGCKATVPNAELKCAECNRPPPRGVTKIKH